MEKIWFFDEDGRVPQSFHVLYDHDENEPIWEIHFKQGKFISEETNVIYNIADSKWTTEEFVRSWDFLPNSSGIPLANEKALNVLEEFANGEFQAIPTEIKLPDGQIIKDYKLINVLNRVKCVVEEKSKLSERPTTVNKYDIYALDPKPFQNLNISLTETRAYIGSKKLKNAIKESGLKGLTFKEKGIREFFVYE